MTIGTGLAVAAMWAAVGLIGYREAPLGVILGIFAVCATVAAAVAP